MCLHTFNSHVTLYARNGLLALLLFYFTTMMPLQVVHKLPLRKTKKMIQRCTVTFFVFLGFEIYPRFVHVGKVHLHDAIYKGCLH